MLDRAVGRAQSKGKQAEDRRYIHDVAVAFMGHDMVGGRRPNDDAHYVAFDEPAPIRVGADKTILFICNIFEL